MKRVAAVRIGLNTVKARDCGRAVASWKANASVAFAQTTSRHAVGAQNNANDTLWYGELNAIGNAIGYAKFYSRSHDAVIHVYDEAGNVIETHEHAGEFKEPCVLFSGIGR